MNMGQEKNNGLIDEAKETLFKKGVVFLSGEIDKNTLDILRCQIILLQNNSKYENIKLLIDSNGGSVDAALVLYDFIQSSKKPIIGIVQGQCSSMAVAILQACQKRIMCPNSWLFFHEIASTTTIRLAPGYKSKIESIFTDSTYRQREIELLLAKHSKQSVQVVKKLMRCGDKYGERIHPKKALEMKFIDAIENFSF